MSTGIDSRRSTGPNDVCVFPRVERKSIHSCLEIKTSGQRAATMETRLQRLNKMLYFTAVRNQLSHIIRSGDKADIL